MKGALKILIFSAVFVLTGLTSVAAQQQNIDFQEWLRQRQELFDRFFNEDDAFGSGQHLFDEMQKMQEQMMKVMIQYQKGNLNFKIEDPSLTGIEKITEEDKGDKTLIHIHIPNLDKSNVKIKVIDDHIQIDGDVTTVTTQSQFTSHFSQSYPLPYKVDPSQINFEYKKDKIVVVLPK